MKILDQVIKRKATATANEPANDVFQSIQKCVSVRTIRRYFRALGYHPYHQTVKKSLRSVQEQSKLVFAQQYMNSDIKKWLFTDEKLFSIRSTGMIAWAKPGTRKPTHYVSNIKTHVQLWGVVWWNGKVFSRYEGYVNSSLYQQLLTTHLTPHLLERQYRFFYQDNIPLHKTPTMLTWFQENSRKKIKTP